MSEDLTELKTRFDDAMMDVYRRALDECDSKATRFVADAARASRD
jgi:hypothetical protein